VVARAHRAKQDSPVTWSGRQPVEHPGLGEHGEAVRHSQCSTMRPPTTRHTSITVKSTGRPLGGPKYGPVAVPRPRTRTQIVSPGSR
jgi:hypothetical protein